MIKKFFQVSDWTAVLLGVVVASTVIRIWQIWFWMLKIMNALTEMGINL